MKRVCDDCKDPIAECMGFVNAGDWLALVIGKRVLVRELCGKCVLRRDLQKFGEAPV